MAESNDTLNKTLNSLLDLKQWPRMRILQVAIDAVLVSCALIGAYLIRFDGHLQSPYTEQLAMLLPGCVCAQLIANWVYGTYRRLWRYTGLTEILELGSAILTVTALVLLARAFGLLEVAGSKLSYGIIFIETGLVLMLFSVPRVFRKLQTEHDRGKHRRQQVRKRALVVGAGEAGQMVVRELSARIDLGIDIVGFVDDDPLKIKKKIGSITVYGSTKDLDKLAENLFVDQVIIAIPSAPAQELRRIVDICRNAEVATLILPGLYELINGRVSVSQLRQVSLEDLLGREPVELDNASIANYVEGRRILVTGAGGSIGSELCRQLMRFQPAQLLLLGKGENSIFSIYQELLLRPEPVKLVPIIADIRDYNRMYNLFGKYRPQVVFHAAAHKHVPLMEENVGEAISNNVRGTQNVAELAAEFRVDRFVLVSSDKAVNPSSVMGATKRIAELVVQDICRRSSTKFVAVRFGNVLDSRGSVIPIWRKQIDAGGPLTVTHPEASRYFMLIPESVQLIIQAGALGKGGEIFVLDMGKPVRILDLARDMIKLSGLRLGQDIEIKYIGLRPGEKLHEELLTKEEGLSHTVNKKILVGQAIPNAGHGLSMALKALFAAAKQDDDLTIRRLLNQLVGGGVSTGNNKQPTISTTRPR
jgi:FlaA1/EpsC-like NDP-sugar epimerase